MLNETIDVLIPVYNCEKYLSICLDSLISQTYKNLRIVLVDDGSTDKSIDILNGYAKKHKNIEVYQKQNEASISKTRNFLLKQIKSEYFSFFDSDDYAEPTYFETLYKNIKNYKADVSIVLGNKIIKKRIIAKRNNNLITIDNELIPIGLIKDIY